MSKQAKKKKAVEVSRQSSAAYLQRHKDLGLVRCCVWIPDSDVARAQIRAVSKLLCKGITE